MRQRWIAAGIVAALAGAIYATNASWLAAAPADEPRVLALRGVHQGFSRQDFSYDTCTAALLRPNGMTPPENTLFENTLPSIGASFDAGASAVEIDVQSTADGEFAVFGDGRLECRTDGQGPTRRRTVAYLKSLDVAYGYTADGGKTFPFQGKGVGMIPTLDEALSAFPGREFRLHIKHHGAGEAERLVAYLKAHGHPTDARLWVLATGRAYERMRQLAPQARVDSKNSVKDCTRQYMAFGWSGHVPQACRRGSIMVPVDMRWLFWGWPNRFLDRMKRADVRVLLTGPYGSGEPGLSHPSQLDAVPAGFTGMVVTERVELIGPALRAR